MPIEAGTRLGADEVQELLGRMAAGERFDRATALCLLDGLAAAVDHAPGLEIVHRDLKPANVFPGGIGSPVPADFGLVSQVTDGTPAYLSPERVMETAVGPAAEIYALTTLAYRLLAGAVPFDGMGELELLYSHVHRVPPLATTRDPDLPTAVDEVLARGLAKDPKARWESGSALVAALREALAADALPAIATAIVAIEPVASPPPPPRPALLGPAVFPAYPPRRPRWMILTAVAAGVVVAVLAGIVTLAGLR